MQAALSVVIPAHNEASTIANCIQSILASAQNAGKSIEIVVALNRCSDGTQEIAEALGARCVIENAKCIAAVRNTGVRASMAELIVTIDADSRMQQQTIAAIFKHLENPRFIGGGAIVRPERMSIGILFSLLAIAPYVIRAGVSTGMFWCSRQTFVAVGGFNEELVSAEDIDFALRLKSYGHHLGRKYGTIFRHGIITSCRKFDKFGDWYLWLNPQLVRALFSGRHQQAANHFYYDVDR